PPRWCPRTLPPPRPRHPLSLHDALPISANVIPSASGGTTKPRPTVPDRDRSRSPDANRSRSETACSGTKMPSLEGVIRPPTRSRSEEHTSELQSRFDLVCRLLLER